MTAIGSGPVSHPQTSQFCLSFAAETQPHWTYQQHATKPFRGIDKIVTSISFIPFWLFLSQKNKIKKIPHYSTINFSS